MTYSKSVLPVEGIQFSGPADPTANIVGARLQDIYHQTTSGELFTCIDATPAAQVWIGSQGTTMAVPAITDPNHPDLTAYYTMNSADIDGTTLTDFSLYNHHGTLVNGPLTEPGRDPLQQAIYFPDGSHIDIPLAVYDDSGDFSLSFWTNARGSSFTYYNLVEFWDSSSYPIMRFGWNWDMPTVRYRTGATANWAQVDAGSTNLSSWHFIVITIEGTNVKTYLNNSFMGGTDTNGGWNYYRGTAPSVARLGKDQSGNSSNAAIDSFRFYNRLLTADERLTLYQEFN